MPRSWWWTEAMSSRRTPARGTREWCTGRSISVPRRGRSRKRRRSHIPCGRLLLPGSASLGDEVGTLEVATDPSEVKTLEEYQRWSKMNGMREDEVEAPRCSGRIKGRTGGEVRRGASFEDRYYRGLWPHDEGHRLAPREGWYHVPGAVQRQRHRAPGGWPHDRASQ